jgi:hypothetical protein
MHLYKIEPKGGTPVHIIARSLEHAAEIFITWDNLHERETESFAVECQLLGWFAYHHQDQLRSLFNLGSSGIAVRDEHLGWIIDRTYELE